ncbi:hypothetical protein BG005_002861 [Podila minutissima]|nr:hypothetical protein BG005_002861 [Podila minutissima]
MSTMPTTSQTIRTEESEAVAEALEALRIKSDQTTLNLQSTSIGNSGAQSLAEALKTNSTLTTLYLQNNSIGENGAQALAEALKTNSTLTLDMKYEKAP